MCKFAFQAIEKNLIAFSEEDLVDSFPRGPSLKDNIFCFGLLQCTESILDTGCGVSYNFLHLTFQEYLAALHLTKQSPETQQEICKLRATSQCYSMVWRFFCGIAFRKTSKDTESCLLSQAGMDIMATLLIPNQDEGYRKETLSDVSLLHYAYEAKDDNAAATIAKEVCKETVFLRPYSTYDCSVLTYIIDNYTLECTAFLNYSNCGIDDKHIVALADSLGRHETLKILSFDLRNNKVSEQSVVYLFNKSPGVFATLKYLYLGGNNIGHKGIESVMDVVPKSCFKRLDISRNPISTLGLLKMECAMRASKLINIKRLDIKGCLDKIDVNSLNTFLKGLSACCPNLWYLDMSDNSTDLCGAKIMGKEVTVMAKRSPRFSLNLNRMMFGDKGVISFIQNLESERHFMSLTLENNNIHALGASCLADKLCIMRQTISEELSLKNNPLGLEGVSVIGRMLSSRHCHINTLTLTNCQLTMPSGVVTGDNLCKVISDVGNFLFRLPQYNTITSLCLDSNNFSGERIHILTGLIHLCLYLEQLSCVSCDITSDDITHLLFRLSKLKRHLHHWDLASNRIDDGGVLTLIQLAHPLFENTLDIYLCDNSVSADMRKKIDRSLEDWPGDLESVSTPHLTL